MNDTNLVGRALASALMSLLAIMAVAGVAQAQDGSDGSGQAESYIGAFAGLGSLDVRMTDLNGFTGSNGVPGQAFEYDGAGLAVGVVAGRYFHLGRLRLLFEADGAFSGVSATPGQLDPAGMDETAAAELRWAGTARIGLRRSLGRVGLFVAGGVSVAGFSNSFTDLDPGTDSRLQLDPDDSFDERPTRVGWVAGAGIEMPVAGAWTLRLEGLYNDFGETIHQAENRRDVNAGVCGPAGLPSPCRYGFDQRLALLRLVLVRRLGR
ncbi:outer membrane beta-barrel protein [Candidatus Palauibacter soopunensis]|uniref:outer membrane protein n=1 Tax=Candidatus Palauibacter soopunensis TaxID=3056739 RepID=UPI00238F527B|nr:outer membrane beta-barrel protein [Candidatus Palauibacter soopunensis]MDE2877625.1 outer membrane beta-barrel protein [Candidatus Palauibacter soopunensis]